MKILLIILMVWFCLLFEVKAQNLPLYTTPQKNNLSNAELKPQPDSIASKLKIARTSLIHRLDSLKSRGKSNTSIQHKRDSLLQLSKPLVHTTEKLNHLNDSVQAGIIKLSSTAKLDSITLSLKQKLVNKLKGDSITDKAAHGSNQDSLQQKVTQKEDKLKQQLRRNTGMLDSLSLNTTNPVSGQPLSYSASKVSPTLAGDSKLPANESIAGGNPLKQQLSKAELPSSDLKIPQVELLGEMKDISTDASSIKQLPKDKLGELTDNKNLAELKGSVAKITSATDKIETYNKDLKNLTTGNTEKIEAIPKDIENAAMKQGPLKELGESTKQVAATKNVLMQYQDAATKINEDGAKGALKNLSTKELPDYFAGNEAKLQAGIAQLEKLKKKYGSIPDSRYLPKHIPNGMKGKPLCERIVPGINFQAFQLGGFTTIDLSPFVMYRVTTRLRSGAGATYRMQFGKGIKPVHLHDAHGYRIMTDYTLFGGFNAHAEGELMCLVPYNPGTNLRLNDSNRQQWIKGLNVGILKTYKAGKHVNGNFQVLYNFLYHRNGLYASRINIRFGLEFPMKKKVKSKTK